METVVFEQPIETIESKTFVNCVSLKSVVLPEGLKTINSNAFQNSGLTELVLPASVENIGSYAFYGCENLTTFTISEDSKLRSINNVAFGQSGLTSIKLPASLMSMGYFTFQNCVKLEKIEIAEPTEILRIGLEAFSGCTAATIYIPQKVTLNAKEIFKGWTAEQTIYVVGRAEADVAEDWFGTFTDLPDNTWQSGCNAKIVWNYTMP